MPQSKEEIRESRFISITLGPAESFESALVKAKRQIQILPDNVDQITIHIHKNVDTKET